MDKFELDRTARRPNIIHCLFVGESRPDSGKFFYHGNSILYSAMRDALADHLGVCDSTVEAFLNAFQGAGYYLDDLVTYPVNKLDPALRMSARVRAIPSLAARVAEYQPGLVVVVGREWESDVRTAVTRSATSTLVLSTAFPRERGRAAFELEIRRDVIPALDRLRAL